MQVLNLGIVAHVDAGKTSLTERLLHAAGVIDAIGRVDDGTTQTDTLAVERERGITVKSAVVSFLIEDVTVNLIDTPGHPDFIAEVDRVLRLLDGAVLVVSAVEGVQAQTLVLMRALQRLGIPTLIFVNKIDRTGADPERVRASIAERLSASTIALTTADLVGTRAARVAARTDDGGFRHELIEVLANHDDDLLRRFVADDTGALGVQVLLGRLATWTKGAKVHPTFLGSAMTGAGVDRLMTGISRLLPARPVDSGGPLSGVVFKIEHAPTGERVAIVRMFSGVIRTRDRVRIAGTERSAKVTRISEFRNGGVVAGDVAVGGQIVKLGGLGPVRIGDWIGTTRSHTEAAFSPPLFEAVVVPIEERYRRRLRVALERLAAEDPLIDLRQDAIDGNSTVSLYGDVQREVIADALHRDFGLAVEFRETTTIHVERVVGTGEAAERMLLGRTRTRPFLAAVGLRVEPAAGGSGIEFSPGDQLGRLPLAFVNAVEDAVHDTLRHGLHGWETSDCLVTMTSSGYWPRQSHAHATFDKGMSSVASDFRQLTPLVLIDALRRAGTAVHEPVHRFRLEAPSETLAAVSRLLAGMEAVVEPPESAGPYVVWRGLVAVARLPVIRQQLPGLTSGTGLLESSFDSYRAVRGPAPERRCPEPDPRHRTNYLRKIADRT